MPRDSAGVASIDLKRFEKLLKKLKTLGKLGAKIAGAGINKALTVLLKEMRKEAPKGKTGNLEKSLGKRFKRSSRRGVVMAKVGANVGIKKAEQKRLGNHVHLVIEGTEDRRQQTTGKFTGRVRKLNGFVKRATKQAQGKAMAIIEKTIETGLAKAAKK